MKKFTLLFLLILVSACSNTDEPIIPDPDDVSMVGHTFANDTLDIEKGIDAVPESDGIYLAWYSLIDRNISSYNIYRKLDDGPFAIFEPLKTIDLEKTKDTTYIDDNAETGLHLNEFYYYYYVTATNSDGKEGGAQDTVRYKLIDKPLLIYPDGDSFDPDIGGLPILEWRFDEIYDKYILRIENLFNQVFYIGIFQSEYTPDNFQSLDLNTIPDLPLFTPGTYLWRIDLIGDEEDDSGSESDWNVFIIL